MRNPYSDRPDRTFWRRAMSGAAGDLDPLLSVPFAISPQDHVATAGSCFAQYISRTLVSEGFNYLVTELAPLTPAAVDQNYGVFSARFGNIYTTRQLLQLFRRTYGLFDPQDDVWRRPDGRFIDAFRPQIQETGFASEEEAREDRAAHFVAVARMFEECDVFVFTLGLTECWSSAIDGAVYPVAPGVIGAGRDADSYRFINLPVSEMVSELLEFIEDLRQVNPSVRIVLTVSPVPLIATYEDRHVLVSSIYSKSALRVVAEMTVQAAAGNVVYFPSYEIIVGPHARGSYFAQDLRDVTPAGVNHVMKIFKRHFFGTQAVVLQPNSHPVAGMAPEHNGSPAQPDLGMNDPANLSMIRQIVCEEIALDPTIRES